MRRWRGTAETASLEQGYCTALGSGAGRGYRGCWHAVSPGKSRFVWGSGARAGFGGCRIARARGDASTEKYSVGTVRPGRKRFKWFTWEESGRLVVSMCEAVGDGGNEKGERERRETASGRMGMGFVVVAWACVWSVGRRKRQSGTGQGRCEACESWRGSAAPCRSGRHGTGSHSIRSLHGRRARPRRRLGGVVMSGENANIHVQIQRYGHKDVTRVVLCHQTVDFDSLAAAVGLARLHQAYVVIPSGMSPPVRLYLATHSHLFPIIPSKVVDPTRIEWLGIVDTQSKDRLGVGAEWVSFAKHVTVYDHHVHMECDIIQKSSNNGVVHELIVESVGAVTTLIVEKLRSANIQLHPAEATLLALGIHADTGNLTFETTTARDARMLAWLMMMGASQRAVAEYIQEPLNQAQTTMLMKGLDELQVRQVKGLSIGFVLMHSDEFVKGMSVVTQDLLELGNVDAILLLLVSPAGRGRASSRRRKPRSDDEESDTLQISVIGRARASAGRVNFHTLFAPRGGGGHAKAAALSCKSSDPGHARSLLDELLAELELQLPSAPTAADLLGGSIPLHNVVLARDATWLDAQRVLASFPIAVVVESLALADEAPRFLGVVSREQLSMAQSKGAAALAGKVHGWAQKGVFVRLSHSIREIKATFEENPIGALPVLDETCKRVVGVLESTDVLRQQGD